MGHADIDLGDYGVISLWVRLGFDAGIAGYQSVSTTGTRWVWTKHGGLRLGPDAARALRAGVCADVPHLGDSSNGPSGEPVSRCLTLKGSFEGGVRLEQNPEICRANDATNQHLVRRWLSHVSGMAY